MHGLEEKSFVPARDWTLFVQSAVSLYTDWAAPVLFDLVHFNINNDGLFVMWIDIVVLRWHKHVETIKGRRPFHCLDLFITLLEAKWHLQLMTALLHNPQTNHSSSSYAGATSHNCSYRYIHCGKELLLRIGQFFQHQTAIRPSLLIFAMLTWRYDITESESSWNQISVIRMPFILHPFLCSSNGSLFHCQHCEELIGSSWPRQDVGGWYWCMYSITSCMVQWNWSWLQTGFTLELIIVRF